MGSYASLRIGEYEILTLQSYIDPTIATIFSESDSYVGNDNLGGDCDRRVYRCKASIVVDRLELLGFTEKLTRANFVHWIEEQKGFAKECLDEKDLSDSLIEHFSKKIELFESSTFDEWKRVFRSIIERKLTRWDIDSTVTPFEKLILDDEDGELLHGYPLLDIRFFLRAALLAFPDAGMVELDLTDLVAAGYYEREEEVIAECKVSLSKVPPYDRKIILVTEGSSDIAILRCALECVAPHLQEYFTFFDFHTTRARGGAPAAIDALKALAAAQVSDRILGLFDNDTAAHAALRVLNRVKLPCNIRYISYPDIELARIYPTLGPIGLAEMNVNGLAGGIEMYLGRDVLLQDDGTLTPVQWRGYEESLKQYQGELMHKSDIQERFFKIVSEWRKSPGKYPERDWDGLSAIFDAIRTVSWT